MKWLFWLSAAWLGYTYAGYIGWLWLRAHLFPQPVRRGHHQLSVSVVMIVSNEEKFLREKLRNLLDMDYPASLFDVVAVSDGSVDATESILRECGDPRLTLVLNQLPRGKAHGLNDGIELARGDLVMFTDARQRIEPDALRLLVENFAEPEVGCASGELMLGDPQTGEGAEGLGLYWKVEKKVRELESASGSVVGTTGALYAVRRELLVAVPEGTILDDVFIPMNVVRQGFRVVFDGRARAWDHPDLGTEREFRRKVRTLTGNYQLLKLAPWTLRAENPLRFEFISHKLMRLMVPLALLFLIIAAWFLPQPLYRAAFWGQVALYGLSLLGMPGWKLGPLTRTCDAAYTFVALNAAAVVALGNFLTGNMKVWTPPVRTEIKA